MPLNQRPDKENVAHLHSMIKINGILKFACKWIELEKNPACGKTDPERQTQNVLTHKWILDVKQKLTSL